MSTLLKKHLKRKTKQSEINRACICSKREAWFNPNDKRSEDRAYMYALNTTRGEYKIIKRKAKEISDAIKESFAKNLVGRVNTDEMRDEMKSMVTDAIISDVSDWQH